MKSNAEGRAIFEEEHVKFFFCRKLPYVTDTAVTRPPLRALAAMVEAWLVLVPTRPLAALAALMAFASWRRARLSTSNQEAKASLEEGRDFTDKAAPTR